MDSASIQLPSRHASGPTSGHTLRTAAVVGRLFAMAVGPIGKRKTETSGGSGRMPRAVDNSPFANASSDSSIRVRKSKIGTHMFDEVEAHVEKMSPKVRGALRSRSSARTRYFLAVVDSSRTVITRMAFGSRLLRTFLCLSDQAPRIQELGFLSPLSCRPIW